MRPPSRLWQILGLLGVIVLAIVVCLAMPGPGERPQNLFKKPEEPATPPSQEPQNMSALPVELEHGKAELGNPEAKVKVVAFIPGASGCGNETVIVLQQVAEANKDRLRVEIVDFEAPEGADYQAELGASCSGLMINGKQVMEVTDDEGKRRTLEFTTNFGESYRESELFLALDKEFQAAYGENCKRIVPDLSQPAAPDQEEPEGTTRETTPGE